MLVLCGSPISNYYNKVKLALLEKGLPFTEELVPIKTDDPARYEASPLGKIPFLRTLQGHMCESQAILEYIEALQPQPPLLPADPYAAAKVRELIAFVDLHLELVARKLYPTYFFGASPLGEANLARIRNQLEINIAAFKRLAKFAPYVAGETFTQADCAAFVSLPLVGMATKAAYGEDLLLAAGVDYKTYVKFISERPSAQRVIADRKAVATR
jgi:glutathione S-transferase